MILELLLNRHMSSHSSFFFSVTVFFFKQVLFLTAGRKTLHHSNIFIYIYLYLYWITGINFSSNKYLKIPYYCALRFITSCGNLMHHFTLYNIAKCPSLSVHRLFIYRSVLGLLLLSVCVHAYKQKSLCPVLSGCTTNVTQG